MTKTDALLAVLEHQRRFAWELAREELARTAARMVAGKTHDALSLVQIVQLAAPLLAAQVDGDHRVFVDDMVRAAGGAQAQLTALLAAARPTRDAAEPREASARTAVAPIIARVVGELAAIADIAVEALESEAATALDDRALTHLVTGLVLDAHAAPRIELTVRERLIDSAPWLEIVRGTASDVAGDHFDLQLVEALAARAGGHLRRLNRVDGGVDLVVALPVVA